MLHSDEPKKWVLDEIQVGFGFFFNHFELRLDSVILLRCQCCSIACPMKINSCVVFVDYVQQHRHICASV